MSILDKLIAFFTKTEQDITEVLTPFEHTLLQKFHPLFQQIEQHLKADGLEIAETALGAIMTAASTGGNIGAAIAATVPVILEKIETDAKAEARNVVYGVAAAVTASLPTAPAPAPVV